MPTENQEYFVARVGWRYNAVSMNLNKRVCMNIHDILVFGLKVKNLHTQLRLSIEVLANNE